MRDTMSGPVTGFFRSHGVLTADGVDLAGIARQVGTPTHVYSGPHIDARFRELDAAFSPVPHRLHYAIKANATLDVVRRLRRLGAGADANSGGEIEVALRAGFDARRHRVHRRREDGRPSSNARSAWAFARSTPSRSAN